MLMTRVIKMVSYTGVFLFNERVNEEILGIWSKHDQLKKIFISIYKCTNTNCPAMGTSVEKTYSGKPLIGYSI
jgi:hypothetical protein